MDKERVKSFADKVFGDIAATMATGLGFVGVRTGLFQAMAGKGPLAPEQIAGVTKLQPRYVEEWLKGMTCAGYLEHDAKANTYALPEEHAYLLAAEGTDHYMGGLYLWAPVLLRAAPKVVEAFERGGGVAFDEYGQDGIEALDLLNRGQYENRLASQWLQALPDIVQRLKSGGRALDFGCGVGRVALTLARAFPEALITGIDTDRESVRRADEAAAAEGLGARARFVAQRLEEFDAAPQFDLILACDVVHDLAAPVETLRQARARLQPDGALFVVEPRANDRLEDNRNAMGAMYYGFSVFHCMTQSLAQGGPGLGTCMGPARTEALMREAGFTRFEQLPIRNQLFAFYAVRP